MNILIDFQKKYGLKPDGVPGKNTLAKIKEVYDIPTDAAVCHFVANVFVETQGFTRVYENLNYSVERMLDVFEHDFDTNKDRKISNAEKARALTLVGHPDKIANFVYANQNGNGNEASGDGWRYRGCGPLNTTGKRNYKLLGDWLKVDLVLHPELLAEKYLWESAVFYFTSNNLWKKASSMSDETIRIVRKGVNGGDNGLKQVKEKAKEYYKALTT